MAFFSSPNLIDSCLPSSNKTQAFVYSGVIGFRGNGAAINGCNKDKKKRRDGGSKGPLQADVDAVVGEVVLEGRDGNLAKVED